MRRIINCIVSGGQSTIIVGEPRSGRTLLLLGLSAPEKCAELYAEQGDKLAFSYVDIQTLGGESSQAQSRKYVLLAFGRFSMICGLHSRQRESGYGNPS